ncbi:large exoprotein [Microbacterium allomyrinae]|uniref:Large exoprotein n=1 Tax=Microbacterium allomyrinae TaxID=2830666 RepID=A0A9X1S1H6_9MICO|nr:large exoprotein [Microbacterium allomyrinae]MCC2030854.1 large exoprotein [Microbacterium allomyrinae]
MGGQVLGGGVIVLVAVLLWLVYLLPTWNSRRQYDAAERNAVRLNQALRVLAETSETPHEVRLELNARTAAAQQRLAKRAMAEREQAALEGARLDLENARTERAAAESAARVDIERARADRAAAEASARRELAAARAVPAARQARTRRRFRLTATLVGLAGLALVGWGVYEAVTGGAQLLLWSGVAVAAASALVLRRMSRVSARAELRATDAAPRRAPIVQDVELEPEQREWAPRGLPRPLTASAGSRAAAVLDAEEARAALRQAALEEAMRARAEAQRPPSIDTARVARTPGTAAGQATSADYSRMGYIDDAEIEAHVRGLLARRAVGQ